MVGRVLFWHPINSALADTDYTVFRACHSTMTREKRFRWIGLTREKEKHEKENFVWD